MLGTMKFRHISAVLSLILLASPVQADELVGIGRVVEITLLPFGNDRCPLTCRPEDNCFSNGCGCGEAKIQIERVLVGSEGKSVTAKYPLGEWCDSVFKPHESPIIFRLADGESPQWSLIYSGKDGVEEFLSGSFVVIGNVKVNTIADKDGMVTVSNLARKLVPNYSSKPTP